MQPAGNDRDEYLTIIARSADEAMAQFKAQGLDRQGYAIAGKLGHHRVALVGGGGTEFIDEAGTIAATFRRTVRG